VEEVVVDKSPSIFYNNRKKSKKAKKKSKNRKIKLKARYNSGLR